MKTPMLFSVGFLVTFLFGGLTGVILASPALDFHVTDSYFVVAHMHYVLFGTVVFAMFGAFLLGASTLAFLWNVWQTHRRPAAQVPDDYWGFGNSLEWATSSPPPRHNFRAVPRIRSERPTFDVHHPAREERKAVEGA